MRKVAPGIYRLPLPNPPPAALRWVNAYLVQGNNGYLLIDTGWEDKAFDSLKKQLIESGIDFEDITQIVVTHAHPDHYGLVTRLKQLSPAKLALHYLEIGFIESRYIGVTRFLSQVEQWLQVNGLPDKELSKIQAAFLKMTKLVAPPVLPDVTLQGGETISTGVFNFQVLWTPGHSSGHISLYEPDRKILFSGDHVLPDITTNVGVGLLSQSSTNPLDDYVRSLNQIRQLEVNLILPGHGGPFTDLERRIEELIQHHEQRNAEILSTIKDKPRTAYEIATRVNWLPDISGIGWEDLDPWNKQLAVAETLVHLESMRSAGELDKFFRDSIVYYRILDTAK